MRWLFPAAVVSGFVALLALPRGAAAGTALSYTDDLASATALATQMVREFGLSEAMRPVSYRGPPAGLPALAGHRGHSERTQWLVDQEVAAC